MRLAVLAAVLAAMAAAETLWPARPWEDRRPRRWAVHGALAAFNAALTRLLLAAPLAALILETQERGWGLANVLGLSGPAELAATAFFSDGFLYWWHRASHRVPFLWRWHKVHHLDTHVDATTALRFHAGELLLSGAAKALWVLAWGPSLAGFVLFEALTTAYAQFHHANVDLTDAWERRLRLVHMTPRLHAAHHTVCLRTRDANFSTVFLLWDRLFGTLREADYGEMRELGLAEGRAGHLSLRTILSAPFS